MCVYVTDLKARMVLGSKEDVNRIVSNALVKVSSNDPTRNSFSSKLADMSFEKFAQACGTKQPLLRFQDTAVFTDEATLSFEQNNKDGNLYLSYCNEILRMENIVRFKEFPQDLSQNHLLSSIFIKRC